MSVEASPYDEFRDGLVSAFSRCRDTADVLRDSGWNEALDDCPFELQALLALFEAQGITAAVTPALSKFVVAAIEHETGESLPSGAAVAWLALAEDGRFLASMLAPHDADRFIVDAQGHGLLVVEASAVTDHTLSSLDANVVRMVSFPQSATSVLVPEFGSDQYRQALTHFARIALSFELLGISETMLRNAINHAKLREQFGRPIGSFQAVRHRLSMAHVELAALRSMCTDMLESDGMVAQPWISTTLKAFAGRSALRIARDCQQVLGAIGFAAEHPHAVCHRRSLTLDALWGDSGVLTAQLGTMARMESTLPCWVGLR